MKKKIAFYLPNLNNGGGQKVILNLMQGLEHEHFEVYLLLGSVQGEYLQHIPNHVNVVNINARQQVFAIVNLAKRLKDIKPHILFSHGLGCNINVLLIKRICGFQTKIITIEHNKMDMFLEERRKFSFLRKRLFDLRYFLAGFLYRDIDAVIAVSAAVAEDVRKYYPIEAQLKVIYNPIIIDDIIRKSYEAIGDAFFCNKTEQIILAVGRLASEKRYDLLIEAFALVNKEIKCKLVILGDGPEKNKLQKLIIDLGLCDSVYLAGYKANPYKYMRKSDVFVVSSNTEGFSLALLEAMACECNVIATRCGGPEEILRDNLEKYLVSSNSRSQLSQKIIDILREPNFDERLLKRAQDFDIKKGLEQYLRIINNV